MQLLPDTRLTVVRGNSRTTGSGKPLYDYLSLANLLQACAALDPALPADTPFKSSINLNAAVARCNGLRNQGIISGNNTAELAASAQAALQTAGFQPESRELHAAMYVAATSSVVTTFGNALGKFSVLDNLCDFSFSGSGAQLPLVFSLGNGIPPMAANGISIFNNKSVGGAQVDTQSISGQLGLERLQLGWRALPA